MCPRMLFTAASQHWCPNHVLPRLGCQLEPCQPGTMHVQAVAGHEVTPTLICMMQLARVALPDIMTRELQLIQL